MTTERCGRHPDVVADGTCERCGDFVCRGCRHHGHPGLCTRCGDRLPRGIAWEDRRYGWLPWRFLLTIVQILRRPAVAFPGPARVGPGLRFVLVSLLLAMLPFTALLIRIAPAEAGLPDLLIGGGVVVTLAALTVVAAQALCFAAGLVAVGRRHGVLRFGLRAASYASVIWWLAFFLGAALKLSIEMTDAGWILILAGWALLTGRVFVGAARGLGLGTQPAILASLGPTLACTVPIALLAYERLAYLVK